MKSALEKYGFENIRTYIQSGNVIFDSDEAETNKIASQLEVCLEQNFRVKTGAVVKTQAQLKRIMAEVPPEWQKRTDIRKYIVFIKEPATVRNVISDIEPKEGVDFAVAGPASFICLPCSAA